LTQGDELTRPMQARRWQTRAASGILWIHSWWYATDDVRQDEESAAVVGDAGNGCNGQGGSRRRGAEHVERRDAG
jgi:hypothetical protein